MYLRLEFEVRSKPLRTAIMLSICVLTLLGCSNSDRSNELTLNELKLGTLPSGVDIFGSRPHNGALLVFESVDVASWVVFFDHETCLLDIERSQSSTRHETVVELGGDDLISSASCNSPDWVRDKGMVATGWDNRQTLISAVMPRAYWSENWSLSDVGQLKPFKVLAISPYSFHLITPYSEVTEARQAGTLGEFVDIQIVCECGDRAMRVHMI